MKTSKNLFVYLFISLFIFSCSDSDSSDDTPPARTYNDVRADFDSIDFLTGANDISLLNQYGNFWNFRVVMPDVDLTNNNRPLIIRLHGASGGNPDAHKNTECYVEPGFAALDPIIISPNGDNFLWEDIYNQEKVLSLIDLAATYLPVDHGKIVVMGYSNGGNGSWFFGESQPNVFSAAIPVASSYNTITNGNARLMEIPMYVIHGENDELFDIQMTQDWVQATVDVGSDITFEMAPGLTHIEPCNYVTYIQNAADWLVNEVWQ